LNYFSTVIVFSTVLTLVFNTVVTVKNFGCKMQLIILLLLTGAVDRGVVRSPEKCDVSELFTSSANGCSKRPCIRGSTRTAFALTWRASRSSFCAKSLLRPTTARSRNENLVRRVVEYRPLLLSHHLFITVYATYVSL